jgi:hypothetical protein
MVKLKIFWLAPSCYSLCYKALFIDKIHNGESGCKQHRQCAYKGSIHARSHNHYFREKK